jgi:hypothetical protein
MAYFLKYFMSCLYLLDVVLLFITFLSSNLKMLAFRNTQYYVAVCYFIIKFKSSNKLYGKEAYMCSKVHMYGFRSNNSDKYFPTKQMICATRADVLNTTAENKTWVAIGTIFGRKHEQGRGEQSTCLPSITAVSVIKVAKGDFEKPVPNIKEGGEKKCKKMSGVVATTYQLH